MFNIYGQGIYSVNVQTTDIPSYLSTNIKKYAIRIAHNEDLPKRYENFRTCFSFYFENNK